MRKLKSNMRDVVPITKRGDEVRVFISPKTVGATQLIMGIAKLPAGIQLEPHVHDYSEETFFALKGNGTVHLKGHDDINFTSGDAVLIPKGVEHWVENLGADEMEVIFASAPLAPKPSLGHRELVEEKQKWKI